MGKKIKLISFDEYFQGLYRKSKKFRKVYNELKPVSDLLARIVRFQDISGMTDKELCNACNVSKKTLKRINNLDPSVMNKTRSIVSISDFIDSFDS